MSPVIRQFGKGFINLTKIYQISLGKDILTSTPYYIKIITSSKNSKYEFFACKDKRDKEFDEIVKILKDYYKS
jgi:hypothetical protein